MDDSTIDYMNNPFVNLIKALCYNFGFSCVERYNETEAGVYIISDKDIKLPVASRFTKMITKDRHSTLNELYEELCRSLLEYSIAQAEVNLINKIVTI